MSLLVGVLSPDRLFSQSVVFQLAGENSLRFVRFNGAPNSRLTHRARRSDVVLVDARTADRANVCHELSSDSGAKIIALGVPDDESAIDVLRAGARGVIFEAAPAAQTARAIHLVHVGDIWAPRRVIVSAWERSTTPQRRAQPVEIAGWHRLSDREREVLGLAATGQGNQEVADRLSIAEATVKAHLTHIYQKLDLRSRSELAAAYYRRESFFAESLQVGVGMRQR
jgi:DNA-binding NarL/FixJ family response regulator